MSSDKRTSAVFESRDANLVCIGVKEKKSKQIVTLKDPSLRAQKAANKGNLLPPLQGATIRPRQQRP
jgi:hypothetical protein